MNSKGDGENFLWQSNRVKILSNSTLWWPKQPRNWVKNTDCLILMAYQSNLKKNPRRPYASHPCLVAKYNTLCEGKTTMNTEVLQTPSIYL